MHICLVRHNQYKTGREKKTIAYCAHYYNRVKTQIHILDSKLAPYGHPHGLKRVSVLCG